jgi:predicted NBD/HSP70 family sugar kinase
MQSMSAEVLAWLRDRGPTSRAEIARGLGVSAAALTKTTAGLIAAGHVAERAAPAPAPQMGRPPIDLVLNGDSSYLVGIHLGAGHVELVVTDIVLTPKLWREFDFDPAVLSVDRLIDEVGRAVNQLIDRSGYYRAKFRGIGIAVPGAVDRAGRLNIYSCFADWHEVPFADRLEQIVGLPAVVEHNVTAMALAEARFGIGRDSDAVLCVYMRGGLGAGLAHSRAAPHRLWDRGPVEIGHIVLDPAGAPCHCGGRGCFETVFSERAILRRLGLERVPDEGLIAAAMRDEAAWRPLYDRLLGALATTATLLAPELIIFGGHLKRAPDAFFDALGRDLPLRLMPQQRVRLRIGRVSLGGDAGALGAACVGLETFIYSGGN